MSVHLKISEFNEKDLKNAYDLVMKKESSDVQRGLLFVAREKENDKFDALIIKDKVNFHYYIVDRENGLEIFDYDNDKKEILGVSYISEEIRHGRNLVSDAIKSFYNMYFEAIK